MISSSVPSIEFVHGASHQHPEVGRGRGWRRILTFTLVFVLVAAAGLAWNFSRAPVYRTAATVLTVKPKAVDSRSDDADLQHVAIQGRSLMNASLLDSVVQHVNGQVGGARITAEGLRAMLAWTPVDDTNLIELSAEGLEPVVLTAAVNAWARSYEAFRQQQHAEAKASTMAELMETQAALEANIGGRRQSLAQFREANDIVSLESADNSAPAQLKGLNASINKAREALVAAQARRAAIAASLRQGKTVMPPDLQRDFVALQVRGQKLRTRLAGIEERFTRAYIDRDPELRGLPSDVQEIESQIEAMRALGRRQAVNAADEAVLGARAAVAELEARLAKHRGDSQSFASLFLEHEAREAEISRLQVVHAKNAERLAQIEARNAERYPSVQVVTEASLPSRPLRPDYTRDGSIVLAVAVVLALFATWLVDYLTAPRRVTPEGFTGVRVMPSGPDALAGPTSAPLLVHDAAPRLAPPAVVEPLELAEVATLMQAADEQTGALIALLLSGLAPRELALLQEASLAGDGELRISGMAPRSIMLSDSTVRSVEACRRVAGGFPGGLTEAGVDASLAIAAVDAGLADPTRLSAFDLWVTYAVFLVRQGVRLADLGKRIGAVPADLLQAFARYSPPGPNRPLEQINVLYPLLDASSAQGPRDS